jgi:hypothetical protein
LRPSLWSQSFGYRLNSMHALAMAKKDGGSFLHTAQFPTHSHERLFWELISKVLQDEVFSELQLSVTTAALKSE